MSARGGTVLYDALGPRARRRVLLGSIAAGAVIALLVYVALRRFADSGQLEADRWELFTSGEVWRFLLGGLVNTLKAASISMVLALALGAALALGRLARNKPTSWLTGGYVETFRAVPLLLLIYFTARLLPRYGINLDALWILVIALVVYNGAVLGEIFRAGILSLDRGQTEAAYAVGLGYWSAMAFVVVPQAVRRMVPALISQLITLLKDTSLGFVLPYEELLRRAQIIGEVEPASLLQGLLVAAAIYVAVNFSLSRLARWLEVRQRRRYRAGAVEVSGIEELAVLDAQSRPTAGTAG
jgi:glutamate transport system permease protein